MYKNNEQRGIKKSKIYNQNSISYSNQPRETNKNIKKMKELCLEEFKSLMMR